MFPNNAAKYIKKMPNHDNEQEIVDIIEKFQKLYGEKYVNSLILTQDKAKKVLDELNVNKVKNQIFYEFYLSRSSEPDNNYKDLLYGLSEIYENYKNSFWKDQYPNLTDRYLQISSIEGEGSYFYDKETDAVYDVNWNEMNNFVEGNLKPMFSSFYDFLEWYYSDEDED